MVGVMEGHLANSSEISESWQVALYRNHMTNKCVTKDSNGDLCYGSGSILRLGTNLGTGRLTLCWSSNLNNIGRLH